MWKADEKDESVRNLITTKHTIKRMREMQ